MSIKVLIVEDSAYQRNLFSEMLSSQHNIEVIGAVKSGDEAIKTLEKTIPDVMVLNVGMAKLDDLNVFQRIIKNIQVPTILLTTSDPKTLEPSLRPLITKAFDLVVKPRGIWKDEMPKIKNELVNKVLAASKSDILRIDSKVRLLDKNLFIKQVQRIRSEKIEKIEQEKKAKYEDHLLDKTPIIIDKLETNVIVMGASVGGPRTLELILTKIPKNFPSPILVVQHMDHFFMRQFAMRLKDKCNLETKLGKNGELIKPGTIYISPGDKHMQIIGINGKPGIRTYEGEPVNYCRPSVDILFLSAVRVYKNNTIGVLLTGMGVDGVAGLKAIKAAGGKTIVESEETAILYGMPKAAVQSGVADLIVPNHRIKYLLVSYAKKIS